MVDEVIVERINLTFIKPLLFFENLLNDYIELIRRSGSDLSIADIKLACSLTNLAQAMAPIGEGFRTLLVKIYEQWCQPIVITMVRIKLANQIIDAVDLDQLAVSLTAIMEGALSATKNCPKFR